MYAESPDFGYANRANEIWPFFGSSYISDGLTSTTGNVRTVTGRPYTFGHGLDLGYLFQQGPDNYVDVIGANGGTLVCIDQNDSGRVVSHQGPGYRTILSSVIFGALQGNDRVQLMNAYVRYLLTGSDITEPGGSPRGRFAIGPSPVRRGRPLNLGSHANARGLLTIYDTAGRLVLTLPFSGSTIVANQLPAGAFVARVNGPTGSASLPFSVVR